MPETPTPSPPPPPMTDEEFWRAAGLRPKSRRSRARRPSSGALSRGLWIALAGLTGLAILLTVAFSWAGLVTWTDPDYQPVLAGPMTAIELAGATLNVWTVWLVVGLPLAIAAVVTGKRS